MSKRELQEEIQQTAKELFLNSLNRRGILLMGTGTGKSRTGVLIAKALKPKSILLLTDSTRGRDVEWQREFEKFKAKGLWAKVEAHCYQSAYKFSGRHWDLCLADELDYGLTPEYSKVFANNTFGALCGLTATLEADKLEMARPYFGREPVLFSYSTQKAQDSGILNKTKFVLVRYRLSEHPKSYKKQLKDGRSFWTSENEAYLYLERQVQEVKDQIAGGDPSQIRSLMLRKKMLTGRRMEFLYGLASSRLIAGRIRDKCLSRPGNKVLVFCKRTEQADLICGSDKTYHSKNKKQSFAIDALNQGLHLEMGVVDAMNRGINLLGVTRILLEAYNSSTTEFQQKHGRGMRLSQDETMYIYILVPYYRLGDRHYHTQSGQWAAEMVQGFKMEDLQRVTMEYGDDELLTLLARENELTRSEAIP